jgi:hypothetical protein
LTKAKLCGIIKTMKEGEKMKIETKVVCTLTKDEKGKLMDN